MRDHAPCLFAQPHLIGHPLIASSRSPASAALTCRASAAAVGGGGAAGGRGGRAAGVGPEPAARRRVLGPPAQQAAGPVPRVQRRCGGRGALLWGHHPRLTGIGGFPGLASGSCSADVTAGCASAPLQGRRPSSGLVVFQLVGGKAGRIAHLSTASMTRRLPRLLSECAHSTSQTPCAGLGGRAAPAQLPGSAPAARSPAPGADHCCTAVAARALAALARCRLTTSEQAARLPYAARGGLMLQLGPPGSVSCRAEHARRGVSH